MLNELFQTRTQTEIQKVCWENNKMRFNCPDGLKKKKNKCLKISKNVKKISFSLRFTFF